MADLRGVLLRPSDLCGSMYTAAPFPMFKKSDASPLGAYEWVFLNKTITEDDRKDFRIRPTGPDNSGPYFHAVLSGMYGVRAASQCSQKWKPQGPYKPSVTRSNYDASWVDTLSTPNWKYYGDIHHIERMYCDGETVICYEIRANDPHATYYTGCAWFTAHSIRNVASFPNRDSCRVPLWHYEAPYRTCQIANMAMFKEKFDYFLWDVLSGLKTGHFDPELGQGVVTLYQGIGKPLLLTDADLSYPNGELTAFEWWDLTGAMEGRYRALAGEAFYNAAMSLPKDTCNSIANVLEAASTVETLIRGDFSKLLPSNPKDAWLFYRYQYTTTKLDVEEYRNLTDRLRALASLPVIRSDGTAHDGALSCHCEIAVDPGYLIPNTVKDWLEIYGLKLSAVNVWDMIPYSFVVDWFTHLGSFLEVLEGENWAYTLPIVESWTSFSSYGPGAQSTYFRVPGFFRAACPFLDYHQRSASGKTIVKRILDSIALFT